MSHHPQLNLGYCKYFVTGADSDAASCLGTRAPVFLHGEAIFPRGLLSDPFPFCDSGELQSDLQRELLILGAFSVPDIYFSRFLLRPIRQSSSLSWFICQFFPINQSSLFVPHSLDLPPAIGSKSPIPGLGEHP